MYKFAAAHANQYNVNTFVFSKFWSTVRALRVNETPRNVFILDFFALEGEKETKYDERTLFWVSL